MPKNRPTPSKPRPVRTLFLSDCHLGYKGFDAWAAANFIRSHDARIIYLVGDIVDGWKMEKRWYWNDACTDFIDALVEKKKQGAKIYYLPGNHDEAVRYIPPPLLFLFTKKLGIKVTHMLRHITQDEKEYVVIHGDQFDSWVVSRPSKFLDRIHEWCVDHLGLPPKQEVTIEKGQLKPWSLQKAIKASGKAAQSLLNRFHAAAARKAMHKKADGLIYGHSHIAELSDYNGMTLANCGTWTSESHTAIIEETDGTLRLQKWPKMRKPDDDSAKFRSLQNITAKHDETVEIIKTIHDIWRRDWNLIPSIRKRLGPVLPVKTYPAPAFKAAE